MKRKICIITGSRAEYGLLKPLITELKKDDRVKLQLIATGMHLSPEFGLTYKEIEKDKFKINERIEVLLSSDTPIGISKAMGLGIISFAEALQRLRPDIIVVLGDRYEIFAAVSAALIARIPVAHIHGGELTEGAFDDSLRHAITKMSHLHFTSTNEYRKRVIQMGENPRNVFNVGALGIDNIKKIKFLSKAELEKQLNFKFDKPTFLVTYHPVTLENNTSEKQFGELLKALDHFKNFKIIFTKPNADTNGRIIVKMIEGYVKKNKERCISFTSMGQVKYLSTLKYVKMMIGNSSSGIIEMPSFQKPTINIGERQKGRIFSKLVVQSNPDERSITKAIEKGLNENLRKKNEDNLNPYDGGNTSMKIKNILLRKFSESVKKNFYDLNYKNFRN